MRTLLEKELAKAHIEAKFTWDIGATENEMQEALLLIRQAQWRWDFGVSSHGGSFHAPQETMRILGHGLNKVFQARMLISKVLVAHGYTDNVPLRTKINFSKKLSLNGFKRQRQTGVL